MRSALALLVGLVSASAAVADAEAPRAEGGVRLVEAAETAPASVVARVEEVGRLDAHGYSARLRVETALRGPISRGAEVRIAWEELAPSRAPRFAAGDRLLVSLVPLPGASIWLSRLPDAGVRSGTLGVAEEGDAFLQRPSAGSVNLLQHYLALAGEDREGPAGAEYLVRLAASAELPLAADAVRRLAGRGGLDGQLGAAGGERLVGALLRPDADPGLQADIVELIGSRQLESTRAPLEALATRRPPPPAVVFAALARLDGGLPAAVTRELLREAPAEHRRVAARWAVGPEAADTVAQLLRADPDAEVRAAAAERLAELGGSGAVEPLAAALGDPDAEVRGAAARRLASLGPDAVPALERAVGGPDAAAAQMAVAALALSDSAEARAALGGIASAHPDPGLRALAKVALGRPVDDH